MKPYLSQKINAKGFTLIELMAAITVLSIIMAAVCSLSYALYSADQQSQQQSFKTAEMRIASMKLTRLLRDARMVFYQDDNDLVIWKSDYNRDGKINRYELCFLTWHWDPDKLSWYRFGGTNEVSIGDIDLSESSGWFSIIAFWGFPESNNTIITEIDDIRVDLYGLSDSNGFVEISPSNAEQARLVNVAVDKQTESGLDTVEVTASLRSWSDPAPYQQE